MRGKNLLTALPATYPALQSVTQVAPFLFPRNPKPATEPATEFPNPDLEGLLSWYSPRRSGQGGHQMIGGVHTILYSKQADAVRAFFRDVLEFPSVDAGQGWLIFAAPPGELAIHPAEERARHELYLMCADIEAEVARRQPRGRVHDADPRPRLGSAHASQVARRRGTRPLRA